MTTATAHTVRAPRGTDLSCRGWQQEAALRMLMNNLDPEVAEKPEELVVYGGSGKAARNWQCFEAIVETLRRLGDILIELGTIAPVDAVFGNVGSLVSFRVGPEDAEFLEKQFEPVFAANDLVNVDNYNAFEDKLLLVAHAHVPDELVHRHSR